MKTIKVNRILGIKQYGIEQSSELLSEVVFVKSIRIDTHKDKQKTPCGIGVDMVTYTILDKASIDKNNDIESLVKNDELPDYVYDRFEEENPNSADDKKALIKFAKVIAEKEKANGALFLGDDTWCNRKSVEKAWDSLANRLKKTDKKEYIKLNSLYGNRGDDSFITFDLFDTIPSSLTNLNICFNEELFNLVTEIEEHLRFYSEGFLSADLVETIQNRVANLDKFDKITLREFDEKELKKSKELELMKQEFYHLLCMEIPSVVNNHIGAIRNSSSRYKCFAPQLNTFRTLYEVIEKAHEIGNEYLKECSKAGYVKNDGSRFFGTI